MKQDFYFLDNLINYLTIPSITTTQNSIELELPGVSRECIKANIINNTLNIFWLDRNKKEEKRQYYVGDTKNIEITYKDGLLTVNIKPEKEKAEVKEIAIKGL